jgi:arylformamidase
MTIEIAAFRKKFTRRAALGGAATMLAAPAFAEDCRIGPPPHAKGPLVWMDMDQVELDAAYDQAFYAPVRLEVIKRLASVSEAVRTRIGQPMRESYGATAGEKLDIFRTKRAKAPIFVFIHGGAWLGGEAKNYRVTEAVETQRHRVRDRGKSGPNLRRLGRSIPLVEQQ